MTRTILDWLTQARQAEKQQKNQHAMSCYQQVLQLDPIHVEATKHLGLLLRQERAWDQLITLYRGYLQHQASAVVYVWLADAYEYADQLEEARLAAAKSVFYFSRAAKPLTHTLDYFWWIKACLKADQPDLAFVALQQSIHHQKSPIQHRLFAGLVSLWLDQYLNAKPARPIEALNLLLLLEQHNGLSPSLQQQALKIAHQYAIYDPQIQRWAEQICEQPQQEYSSTIDTAFDFLLCAQGVTPQLLAGYQRWLADHQPSERYLLGYAQVLLAQQDYAALSEVVGRYSELLAHSRQHPAIAWVKINTTPAAELTEERALWSAYQQVVQDSEHAWAELADPVHQIAVVGNSPCERGRGQGAQIDQHDRVIRFNAFDLAAPYAPDYGTRVDWVVRSAASDANLELDPQYQHKTVVISYIGFLARFRGWPLVQRLQAAGHRVCCYPAHLHQGLIQTLQRSPSAGLSMVWLLKQLRASAIHAVDYYGFAFTDQIGESATSSHYFEQATPSLRHAWQQERGCFEQWVRPLAPIVSANPTGLPINMLGDHAAYHCGSAAVTAYFEQQMAQVGHRVTHDQYAVLVVNGEGSMHHRSNAYLQKMRQITLALAQHKRVYLLNTVWQDNQNVDQDIIAAIHQITVRESMSQTDLRESVQRQAEAYLDCSFWAPIDEQAPVTDFAKATVCTDFYSPEFDTFVKVTGGLISKYHYIDMQVWNWSSLVQSLKTASLLVTGRHHAMYAACRARLPFVVMAGNTHKIEGLLSMAGVEIPVCQHPRELRSSIIWARKNKAVYQQLFDWMEAQPRWQLRDLLSDIRD